MKRKEYMIFRFAFLLVSVLLLAAACNRDDDKGDDDIPPPDNSAEVIARFKDYFYDDGKVFASRLLSYQPAEWALATRDAQKPLEVFRKITGMSDAAMKSEYEYRYQSSGRKCTISIKGRAEADTDEVFATMSVDIPEHKDIKTMHFATIDHFKKGEMDPGVPVLYAK